MEVSEVVDLRSMGLYLQTHRVSLGMSQSRMAEATGVSERMIRHFEIAEWVQDRNPSPLVLGKILAVLKEDDFPTLVHFLRVMNEARNSFSFSLATLPPGNRERFRRLLATLATIVSVRDVCPSARYSELSVKLLREALEDGSSESSDSWTELLGHPPSPAYGGRAAAPDGVLEMASAD